LLSPDSPLLAIELSRRVQNAIVIATLGIVLIVPVALLSLSMAVNLVIAIASGAFATVAFWRIGWLTSGGVTRAIWFSDGQWQLIDRTGRAISATLLPGSRTLGRLTWLRFRTGQGPREIVVLDDKGGGESYRRLSVRLRLEGAFRQGVNAQDPGLNQPEPATGAVATRFRDL
jgi:hypothetical protein